MKRILLVIVTLLLVPTLVKADESVFEDMTDEEKIEELIRIVIDLEQRIEELENREVESVSEEVDTSEEVEIDVSGISERELNNALEKAQEWADRQNWSKETIEEYLVDWENFPDEAAKYAVENIDADFKQNALNKAQEWADNQSWSDSTIRQYLSDWEGFTEEEIEYAMDNLD